MEMGGRELEGTGLVVESMLDNKDRDQGGGKRRT